MAITGTSVGAVVGAGTSVGAGASTGAAVGAVMSAGVGAWATAVGDELASGPEQAIRAIRTMKSAQ